MTPRKLMPRPRWARLAARAIVFAGAALMASLFGSPALADVPEGWAEPTEVKFLDMFGLLIATPLALLAVISLLAYAPTLVARQRALQASEEAKALEAAADAAASKPRAIERS